MVTGPRPLPGTDDWQPRRDKTALLHDAFRRRCRTIEEMILLRAQHEREWNIDNYDSGLGVEGILRDELGQVLPARRQVGAGVISDGHGYTAGHCDLVIHNELWFPTLKEATANGERRVYYPVDGLYGVAEVKQTLSEATLRKGSCRQCHIRLAHR